MREIQGIKTRMRFNAVVQTGSREFYSEAEVKGLGKWPEMINSKKE